MDALTAQSATEQEVGRAADVIARTFHRDPLDVYLFPDENDRSRLSPRDVRGARPLRPAIVVDEVERASGIRYWALRQATPR